MARLTQEDPWAKIPHWVVIHPELDASAIRVYLVLSKHANKARDCFPGTRKIAEEAHLSRSTVHRSLSALESIGALEIERGRIDGRKWQVNQYHLPMNQRRVVPSSDQGVDLPQDQGGPIDPPGGGPVVVPELEDELDKDLLRHLEPMPPRMEGESPSAYLRRINT